MAKTYILLLFRLAFVSSQEECYRSAANAQVVGLVPYNRMINIFNHINCLRFCKSHEAGGKQPCRSVTFERDRLVCNLYRTAAVSDGEGRIVVNRNVDYYEMRSRCFHTRRRGSQRVRFPKPHRRTRPPRTRRPTPRPRTRRPTKRPRTRRPTTRRRTRRTTTPRPRRTTRKRTRPTTKPTTTTRKPTTTTTTTTKRTTTPPKKTTKSPGVGGCPAGQQEYYASSPNFDSDSLNPAKEINDLADASACLKLCGQNRDKKGNKLSFKCKAGTYDSAVKACILFGNKPKSTNSLDELQQALFFEKMCIDPSDCANGKTPTQGKPILRQPKSHLVSRAIKDKTVSSLKECLDLCIKHRDCKSIGLLDLGDSKLCELNDKTHEGNPKLISATDNSVYMENPCN